MRGPSRGLLLHGTDIFLNPKPFSEIMWKELTQPYIESVMSSALYVDYQAWITSNPEKGTRLAEIIQQTVAEFRSAIQVNGLPLVDARITALPESCVRHAQSTILFELKKEMGINLAESENIAAVRADIFLRGIWTGTISVTADSSTQTPSYQGVNQ